MSLIFILLFVALLLFLLELIVPSGLIGVVGFMFICGASVAAYFNFGPAPAIAVFVGGGLLAVFFLVLELKFLTSSRLGKKWFQNQDAIEDIVGIDNVEALVGKTGEALTAMSPSGKIRIDQTIYHAASLDGFLAKGSSVVVKQADRAVIRVTAL